MFENDDALANEDVLNVLRQQLPAELRTINSVEELLEYGIKGVKAERDAAIQQFVTTKKMMANVKLLSRLEDSNRGYMDIGNNVLLPARLKGKKVLVNIGYQFYLEMEPEEVEEFSRQKLDLIQSRIEALNRKVAEQRAQAFIIAEALCSMSEFM